MNRHLLYLASLLIVLLFSCKAKNTTITTPPEEQQPSQEKEDEYSEITLAYGCAYGDANTQFVGEELFAFAIGDVHIDASGEVSDNSNGYYLQLVLYADELTRSQLFKPGTFPLSSEVQPWTARSGYDVDPKHPGYAYGGSLLYKVEDGFLTDAVKLTSGTVALEGTADNARFVIDASGSDGKEYKYKSSGAVRMVDSIPLQEDFYSGYEWDSVQEITINANYCKMDIYTSYNMFTLYLKNTSGGYNAKLSAYFQGSGRKTVGVFPVGSDPYDDTPGTTLYSRGYRDGALYYSYAGVSHNDGVSYDYTNYSVFFITGGSMTIEANDNLTASFTTYYGSTVNVNFTGTFKREVHE